MIYTRCRYGIFYVPHDCFLLSNIPILQILYRIPGTHIAGDKVKEKKYDSEQQGEH